MTIREKGSLLKFTPVGVKPGVLNLHEGTYLLTNPIPNCPLLQNLRHDENDITTTNSTKLFLIYVSEIIIQCLEFSGFS